LCEFGVVVGGVVDFKFCVEVVCWSSHFLSLSLSLSFFLSLSPEMEETAKLQQGCVGSVFDVGVVAAFKFGYFRVLGWIIDRIKVHRLPSHIALSISTYPETRNGLV